MPPAGAEASTPKTSSICLTSSDASRSYATRKTHTNAHTSVIHSYAHTCTHTHAPPRPRSRRARRTGSRAKPPSGFPPLGSRRARVLGPIDARRGADRAPRTLRARANRAHKIHLTHSTLGAAPPRTRARQHRATDCVIAIIARGRRRCENDEYIRVRTVSVFISSMMASVFADARTTDVRAACVGRATDFYARDDEGYTTHVTVSLGVWVKSPFSHPLSSVSNAPRARTVPSKYYPYASPARHPRSRPIRAYHAGPSPRQTLATSQPSGQRRVIIVPPFVANDTNSSYTYLGNLGGERRGGDDASGGGGDREGHRVNGVARAEA
jgi:hypothetical protein